LRLNGGLFRTLTVISEVGWMRQKTCIATPLLVEEYFEGAGMREVQGNTARKAVEAIGRTKGAARMGMKQVQVLLINSRARDGLSSAKSQTTRVTPTVTLPPRLLV
jgi:hypothetical protein